MASSSEMADLVKRPGGMLEWAGEDRRFFGYPCSNNTVYNIGAFMPVSEIGDMDDRGHGASGEKDNLIRGFMGFPPEVRALIAEAEEAELKSWALMWMDPLPTWIKGKVALLGDAAHPFQPWFGQGAAMAIEDAISIATILPLGTTPDQVPSRLALYEQARMVRIGAIMDLTKRNSQEVSPEHRLTPAEFLAGQKLAFGHDERKHSARLLEEALNNAS